MATVNAIKNTILVFCFLHCCERIAANSTQEGYRQHIKEFMQKPYLRNPHACFACRHYCAAASILVDLQYMYMFGMKTIIINMALLNMHKVQEAV